MACISITPSTPPLSLPPCEHSDNESDTSSVVYHHEPFATFRSRVLTLALNTFWHDATEDEITVERLRGGTFNRIIGLTRQKEDDASSAKTQYILRVPRFEAGSVGNDVAALRLIREQTDIPTPQVITFDRTGSNALGSPYSVLSRVEGTSLHQSFPFLRHEQRLSVAQELGGVVKQMLAVRSSRMGKLDLTPDVESLDVAIGVDSSGTALAKPYSGLPTDLPIDMALRADFLAQKEDDLSQSPAGTGRAEFMDRFCNMVSELATGGWMENGCYSVAHLDFATRNIIVNPAATAYIVSGILDWDSAVFAPMFMSCAPPMWIWAWQDDDEEDEKTANDDPGTFEGRQLKEVFDKAAGKEYVKFAYEPAYRLARRLVRFVLQGIQSNMDFYEAQSMLDEWENLSALSTSPRRTSH